MKQVQQATLKKKLRKWQKALKLDGWDIKIRYKICDQDTAAQVEYCEPVEKTAVIDIHPNYSTLEGCGVSWDLDSLIIHELIHIDLWHEIERLPNKIKENGKFKELEEHICFSYAKIIGDMHKRR